MFFVQKQEVLHERKDKKNSFRVALLTLTRRHKYVPGSRRWLDRTMPGRRDQTILYCILDN